MIFFSESFITLIYSNRTSTTKYSIYVTTLPVHVAWKARVRYKVAIATQTNVGLIDHIVCSPKNIIYDYNFQVRKHELSNPIRSHIGCQHNLYLYF